MFALSEKVWGEYKRMEGDWARCKKSVLSHQSPRVSLVNFVAFYFKLALCFDQFEAKRNLEVNISVAHSCSYLQTFLPVLFPLVISCVSKILVELINGT